MHKTLLIVGLVVSHFFLLETKAFIVRDYKTVKYQTFFGQCPSRRVGKAVLKLVEKYRKSGSLYELKKNIQNEKIMEKNFLSSYKIEYNYNYNTLKFSFECPRPFFNVSHYSDSYELLSKTLLVENGTLVDPTYEILLRNEDQLQDSLPSLISYNKVFFPETYLKIIEMISKINEKYKKTLSEVIIDNKRELNLIFSFNGLPTSVYMGNNHWTSKIKRLNKIVNYMNKKGVMPSFINLGDLKKVVVKFSDTF